MQCNVKAILTSDGVAFIVGAMYDIEWCLTDDDNLAASAPSTFDITFLSWCRESRKTNQKLSGVRNTTNKLYPINTQIQN